MTTDITRNVIIDLLPAYLSGESSPETRNLVESYAASDPQIARLIQSGGNGLPKVEVPEAELGALLHTRKRVRKQGWHLGLAIFFTLFATSFRFGPEGVFWTVEYYPVAAVTCAILALIFWVGYFGGRRRLRQATGV